MSMNRSGINPARLPRSLLLLAAGLALLAPAASATGAQMYGRLSFVDDMGNVLIDLGDEGNGWEKYGVKLSGVRAKDGLANAVTSLVPLGMLVRVQIVKAGSLPEVLLFNGNKNINAALAKKGFSK